MRDVLNHTCRMLIIVPALGLLLTGCGKESSSLPSASIPDSSTSLVSAQGKRKIDIEPVALVPDGQAFQSPARAQSEFYPEILITTSLGNIRVRLNAEKAPRTVDNFLYNYVEDGFYDQTMFHFVEPGYMLAGGGYTPELQEKPTHTPIPCEANNGLSNRRGTIAMARHPDFIHSATSQFFINLVDNPSLDHRPSDDDAINGYCVFGEVIEGMEVVDRISSVPTHDRQGFVKTPVDPVVIEAISRVK
ncbi:MAG: peptidylprolyl isomerase [Pirellulaceae bacterium]